MFGLFSNMLFAGDAAYTIPRGVLLGNGLSTAFVAKFAFFLAFLLMWTIAWGRILKVTLRFPVIAGQIIGGILIGPSFLNILGWSMFAEPLRIYDTLGNLYQMASSDLYLFFVVLCSSALTVTYLLWIAGHETDVRDIFHVGVTATAAGLLGALLPIFMTVGAAYYFLQGYTLVQSIGIGLIFSATSVSIPVTMLVSMRKMHLKSSKATLGAAIIDDVFSVILLSMFFIALQSGTFGEACFISHGGGHGCSIAESLVYMMISFAGIFLAGYFLIPPILKWLKEHHSSFLLASFANIAMLFYFAFAELIGGLAGITGAFFAGLFHRMGDSRHQAEKTIAPYVRSFLLPVFLGSIGLQLDISVLTYNQWVTVFLLLIVAILSKLIACYAATFMSNVSGRRTAGRWTILEGYLFGSSMIARGEVGLVISTILRGSQVITADQYIIAVVVIVLTTIVTPFMLAIGFHRLSQVSDTADYEMNLGAFGVMGTQQLFNIILGQIAVMGDYNTVVEISEGRKVVSLEGKNVKIFYEPEEGIIFRGDRKKIEEIVSRVRKAMQDELERLPDNKVSDE
jgi:Kef-type K+ transport system membrane component KefB